MTLRQFDLVLRPGVGMQAQSGTTSWLDPFHPFQGVGAVQQHPGMAGADRRDRCAVRWDGDAQHGGEDALFGAFGVQHPLQLAHPIRAVQAGERECAPSDP